MFNCWHIDKSIWNELMCLFKWLSLRTDYNEHRQGRNIPEMALVKGLQSEFVNAFTEGKACVETDNVRLWISTLADSGNCSA